MIGCPGGGNEIRLKTTPDATTDCMPSTSLRLRLILILIHHHHLPKSKSQVHSNTPSHEKLKQIYKVTNQEITTTISHSRMFCSKSDYIAQQIKSIFFVCCVCVNACLNGSMSTSKWAISCFRWEGGSYLGKAHPTCTRSAFQKGASLVA